MCWCVICKAVDQVSFILDNKTLRSTYNDMIKHTQQLTKQDSEFLIKYVFLKMLGMGMLKPEQTFMEQLQRAFNVNHFLKSYQLRCQFLQFTENIEDFLEKIMKENGVQEYLRIKGQLYEMKGKDIDRRMDKFLEQSEPEPTHVF